METVVVAGVFALFGAIIGSVLTGVVQRVVRDQTARTERLDSAIKSVAVALAARQFSWSVGMTGAPPNVTPEDEAESARTLYLRGVDRYLTALHDAKRELAIVAVDGVATGLAVDVPDGELGNVLAEVYDTLMERRGPRSRAAAHSVRGSARIIPRP